MAKTYEDGEDKKIKRWETLNPLSEAMIKNTYDKAKSSRVIEFDGNGTKSAYILKIDAPAKKHLFSWQMKYSEDFVIFISLETKLGKRYLIYTPGDKNGYMQYGLGYTDKRGTWQRYSRNLEKDLQYFDNRNAILKINSFVIRGSGSIDNIKIMKELNSKNVTNEDEFSKELENKPLKEKEKIKKNLKSISKSAKKIKKKTLRPKHNVKTNTTPVIDINGENPLFLNLGERFVEPGVSAKDKEDGELSVTSSENIDRYQEGKYVVIYMAVDSVGNSAVDKRYVIIGEVPMEEEEDTHNSTVNSPVKEEELNKSTSLKDEGSDATEYRLEERELEIAEWERELQFREKEISQREKSLLK
jgi:hypothetical protein